MLLPPQIFEIMYIIPLCSGCNHRNDYFFVDENLLVPAPLCFEQFQLQPYYSKVMSLIKVTVCLAL